VKIWPFLPAVLAATLAGASAGADTFTYCYELLFEDDGFEAWDDLDPEAFDREMMGAEQEVPMRAAAALVVLGLVNAGDTPDTAAVVELEQRLVAAIGARDLSAYDGLVADDYVVIEAAGTVRTKADVMASYRAGQRGYRDLRIDEVKAHVFGDTAVVHARTTGIRILEGKEEPNRVRYVRVYARRSGRWQAVAQMATPLPPKGDR
jgi:ketosteroid isomerase-like protein